MRRAARELGFPVPTDERCDESGHASPQQVAADFREQLAQLFGDETP